MGVPPKKYVEDIPMVKGEVHAKFGPDLSSSLGGEWRQTNKQTDRQTDTPFCYIYIDLDQQPWTICSHLDAYDMA